jgi:hypothetical protein
MSSGLLALPCRCTRSAHPSGNWRCKLWKDLKNDLSQLNRLDFLITRHCLTDQLQGIGAEARSQLSTSAQVLAKSQELIAKSFLCTE